MTGAEASRVNVAKGARPVSRTVTAGAYARTELSVLNFGFAAEVDWRSTRLDFRARPEADLLDLMPHSHLGLAEHHR